MSESRLVIQLVSGLTRAYRGVGTLIRQSDPLPLFYQARSMLTLEEVGFAKEAATRSDSAMIASSQSEDSFVTRSNSENTQNRGKQTGNRKSGKKSGNNSDSNSGGRGQGSNGGRQFPHQQQ